MKRNMPLVALAALMSCRPMAVLGSVRGDAGAVAAQLAALQQSLDKTSGEVRQTAEAALAEAKKTGTLSAETKMTADKLLSDFNGMGQQQTALQQKLEALETKNSALEQAVADGNRRGGNVAQSLGQMVASHEGIKQFLARGDNGQQVITVKNAVTTAGGSGVTGSGNGSGWGCGASGVSGTTTGTSGLSSMSAYSPSVLQPANACNPRIAATANT